MTPETETLLGTIERTAAALGRLGRVLVDHPLAEPWAQRMRIRSVIVELAGEGHPVDETRFLGSLAGAPLRYDPISARAEQRACAAYRDWGAAGDVATRFAAGVVTAGRGSILYHTGGAIFDWLHEGGDRAVVRVGVGLVLQRSRLLAAPAPFFGAAAFRSECPRAVFVERWVRALGSEALDGLDLLQEIGRRQRGLVQAVGHRRADSRLHEAGSYLVAAGVMSPARLARLLGISTRGASGLLAELVACGFARELTRRGSHKLYEVADGGLGRQVGRPTVSLARGRPRDDRLQEPPEETEGAAVGPLLPVVLQGTRAGRSVDWERLLADTDAVIARTDAVLREAR